MTASYISQIDPYWFGRPEQEVRAAVEARLETWASVVGYKWYEWSDKGRARSLPRTIGSRHVGGTCPLKFKPNNSGYLIHNVVPDAGKQVTVAVAPMVLLAHHPAFRGLASFPAGLETRHNPSTGPLFNAYPEGLWPGTKLQNEAEKIRAPKVIKPPTPCLNHDRCGGYVTKGGRRCHECVVQMGRDGTRLAWSGVSLPDAAEQLEYASAVGLHALMVKYGGYGRPPLRRRVTVTLRGLLWRSRPLITGSDGDDE